MWTLFEIDIGPLFSLICPTLLASSFFFRLLLSSNLAQSSCKGECAKILKTLVCTDSSIHKVGVIGKITQDHRIEDL